MMRHHSMTKYRVECSCKSPNNPRVCAGHIVQYLVDRDMANSSTIHQSCQFQFSGPANPVVEWLGVDEHVIVDSVGITANVSQDGITSMKSTTDSKLAVGCRLTVPLFSCGHAVGRRHFQYSDVTGPGVYEYWRIRKYTATEIERCTHFERTTNRKIRTRHLGFV